MSGKKVFQFIDVPRQNPRETPVALRIKQWNEIYGRYDAASAAEQSSRCLDCGNPYCAWQCPLHNDIPNWLSLVQEDRLFEAAELAHETNPLPEICGRVCPQDRLCEGACTIQVGFEAVSIGAIEKYIVDQAFAQGWRPRRKPGPALGKPVAVVGAGPAGLSAADRLARAGVEAHVFDRYEEIGGLLSFGIPPFKLEPVVMATRRLVLEELGVRFHLGVEVGRDIACTGLLDDFAAVFLGTGAYRYVDADLPGQQLAGVLPALPFLVGNARSLLGSKDPELLPIAGWSGPAPAVEIRGRRVLVLGGGDTAMDCVRTAIRLGAATVTCVYRRDQQAMPGSQREVKNAGDEGVQFLFNRQPLAIVGDTEVSGLRLVETRPGRGREGQPEWVPGSETVLAADVVITAFGFRADPPEWLRALTPERHPDQRLIVGGAGRLPMQTAHPRVFAGGDNVRGADLVVNAVLDGREAAASILKLLG